MRFLAFAVNWKQDGRTLETHRMSRKRKMNKEPDDVLRFHDEVPIEESLIDTRRHFQQIIKAMDEASTEEV